MNFLPISYFDAQGTKNNKPIWGINTAATSEIGVEGEILLRIPAQTGNGQPDMLRVPQTWLPIELTRDITRTRLLNSSELRRAVSQGLVSLIATDDAEAMLRQNGAAEEKKRLDDLRRQVRTAGAARTIGNANVEVTSSSTSSEEDGRNRTVVINPNDGDDDSPTQIVGGVSEVEKGIKPNFKAFVDKINNGGDDIGAKNAIRGRAKFSSAELNYLSRNLDKSFELSHKLVSKTLTRLA